MTSRRWLWPFVVFVGMTVALAAQTPKPTFEVVSVRPTTGTIRLSEVADAMPRVRPGGVFNPTHTTVEALLMFAHDLREYRIVGGPDWIRRDFFSVDARAGNDAPAEQVKLMVQSLLEERFKLATHKELREMRFQALVRARPNGLLGPRLIRMDECSAAITNELRRKFPEKYPTPGGGISGGCFAPFGTRFADYLSVRLGTPVIDATGIQDGFYVTLSAQLPVGARLGVVENTDPDLPALSTALEEQLGLRLESRRGPLEVLVIDSVQQPTPN